MPSAAAPGPGPDGSGRSRRPAAPWLAPADVDRLREALSDFTVDGVGAQLAPRGLSCLDRGDLQGAARALRGAGDARVADLVSLFLLGGELDESRAARALDPLPVDVAVAGSLVERSGASVRAGLEVRPYAEAGGGDWWVVSDVGADARPGPLSARHVLGIGSASLTLVRATPRDPVRRALDVGTGCGVQSLHLSGHSDRVTATDVSDRALRCAATTAALSGQALSGQQWDLRRGSLLDPVAGERVDLVVANPPFVVSAGAEAGGLDYRDSGLAGDAVCENLLRGLPGVLSDDGCAVVLANWVLTGDEAWSQRLERWLAGRGCDAWAWQREVAGPEEYVSLWLRDAGRTPADPDWAERYDAWCGWFDRHGVAGVGMGLVALWRTDATSPVLGFDDVRQAVEQPVGAELTAWVARARWLRDSSDAALLDARLHPAPDLVLARGDLLGDAGWTPAAARLRQSHGLRWEVEVDDPVATLIAGLAAGAPVRTAAQLLAAALGLDEADVLQAVVPTVRDLVARGFLTPHAQDGAAPCER